MGANGPGFLFRQRSTKNSMERPLVLDGNRLSKMSANSKYFFPLPGSTFFKGLAESGVE